MMMMMMMMKMMTMTLIGKREILQEGSTIHVRVQTDKVSVNLLTEIFYNMYKNYVLCNMKCFLTAESMKMTSHEMTRGTLWYMYQYFVAIIRKNNQICL
jgi:hypothetical protein